MLRNSAKVAIFKKRGKMPKKITTNIRKELLKSEEEGLSESKLMERFRIKDKRTLRRQLKLARQEQNIGLVRKEVLKDALSEHLNNLRNLILEWRNMISVPPYPSCLSAYPVQALQNFENRLLFPSIKDHLPFPPLWRDYKIWKTKFEEYLTTCRELRERIRSDAVSRTGLVFDQQNYGPGLTESFDKAMVKAIEMKRSGTSSKYTEGRARDSIQYLQVNSEVVFWTENIQVHREIFQKMVDDYFQSEELAKLTTQFNDLENLSARIQGMLEEILERQDYIIYSCNLCPGQGRLLR